MSWDAPVARRCCVFYRFWFCRHHHNTQFLHHVNSVRHSCAAPVNLILGWAVTDIFEIRGVDSSVRTLARVQVNCTWT